MYDASRKLLWCITLLPVHKTENTAVGIRRADHAATSIRKKVGTNFADKRRSLVGVVHSRTQATEFLVY
jgi:hypothetical protein